MALCVCASRVVERSEISVGLIGANARPAKLFHEQAGRLQREIAYRFGLDAQTILPNEQSVVRIACFRIGPRD